MSTAPPPGTAPAVQEPSFRARVLVAVDRLLPSDVAAAEPPDRRRGRTLVITSFALSLLCFLAIGLSATFTLPQIDAAVWLAALGFAVVPLVYRTTGQFQVAVTLFLVLGYLSLAVTLAQSGGMRSVFVLWLTAYPATVLAVTGYRGAVGALVAVAGLCLALLGAERAGVLAPAPYPIEAHPISLAMVLIEVGAVLLVASYAREIAVEDLTRFRIEDERARARAEAASRAKSAILASVSHELRTPMTGILGLSDMLDDSDLGDKQRAWVHTIRSTGGALLALLDDLLDSARLEAGTLPLHPRAYRPDTLVRQVVALFEPEARSKGLELQSDVSPEMPTRLRGDPVRIRQVLINLVGNAVKFTRSGTIQVSARTRDGQLVLWVSDTGIGIPKERIDEIFAPFVQLDPAVAGSGVGLGLSIARTLVTAMGGTLEVESHVGAGSTFWVRLPLTDVTEDDDPTESTMSSDGDGVPLRILVAEDNPVNQLVLRTMLETMGHTVELVDDGTGVVPAAIEFLPDVVLMDVRMGRMDGLEATRRLRALPRFARTPVLALTANTFDDDKAACMEAGMNGVLAKPVHRDALRRALTI